MYIPIVCPNCGLVIGHFAEELRQELDRATAEAGKSIEFGSKHGDDDLTSFAYIFEKYGITPDMWCDRNILMTYTNYYQHLVPPNQGMPGTN